MSLESIFDVILMRRSRYRKAKVLVFFVSAITVGFIMIIPFVVAPVPSGVKPVITRSSSEIERSINTTGMPLKLPPGFSISIFAEGLGKPRVMTWGKSGLMVSLTAAGKVMELIDTDGDGNVMGQYDWRVTLWEGLNRPHGLVVRQEGDERAVYVAESHQVTRFKYNDNDLALQNPKMIIALPDGGEHFTRTIMEMPGSEPASLLVSVGSSCNVCTEKDDRRAGMLLVNLTEHHYTKYAAGLRNSVFMATHPITGQVWATEMGRDLLGDNIPPDEINIIHYRRHYGWPYCYGKNAQDPFGKKRGADCTDKVPSHIDIPAHSAPLGLAFIPEEGWPEEYWHDLLVAYHGSWNRSEPTGYKIVRIKLDDRGNYQGTEDFITGWLTSDDKVLGRPVDILVQPGGIMYVSDDKAGVIYRITYQPK